jgi:hypothetical protein
MGKAQCVRGVFGLGLARAVSWRALPLRRWEAIRDGIVRDNCYRWGGAPQCSS